MTLVLAAFAALVMACSGEGAPGSGSASGRSRGGGDACGPLKVVVEGKELAGLGPVYGARYKKGTAIVWHLETTDGTGHSCDEVLRGGRAIKKGEHVIAADISSDRSYFTGVRHNARSLSAWRPDQLVQLSGPPPTKVGDPITICIDADLVEDIAKGDLSIGGALSGTYCGEP